MTDDKGRTERTLELLTAITSIRHVDLAIEHMQLDEESKRTQRELLSQRLDEIGDSYRDLPANTPELVYFNALRREYGLSTADYELKRKLDTKIDDLDISVRAINCLTASGHDDRGMVYLGELVKKTEGDLLKIRSFGRTPLREVKRKLEEMGLTLGMTVDYVRPK